MNEELLYEASRVWCPDFPRQSTYSGRVGQRKAESREELVSNLTSAANQGGPGYYSVYSFPRGHSKEGNIPDVDTLFIDFDIPSSEGKYDPQDGGEKSDWQYDMSRLLVRVRMVAQAILDAGIEDAIRASLSGHKGIHLYVDFHSIPPETGKLVQFKNGLSEYADGLIDTLANQAEISIEKWIDVTSHDLGRLARHPNTPHNGAKHVEWTPYCVPISVKELAHIDPRMYLRKTSDPQPTRMECRTPSERTSEVVESHVSRATNSQQTTKTGSQSRDESQLEGYQEESNDKIDIETIENFLLSGKPCIKQWRHRDDAFQHGQESRTMQINVIKELAKHNVPIDVIVKYFSIIPGFEEQYSRELIEDVIARYHPSSFVCRNIVGEGGEFCLGTDCKIYQRSDDLEIH